jgi:uncharacterized protein involved in outer membrane biogenesis
MGMEKKRRFGLGKKLLLVFGILVVLLVVGFFIVTSSAFFKGVILPRVGKSMNADITVADATLKPFSSVELRQLKVTPHGAEQVLQAEEVRARYNLRQIIAGNIDVEEVTLVSPVIHVVEQADGKSNIDALTKKEEKKTAEPSKAGKTPELNIRNVSLKNATVERIRKHKDGSEDVARLSNVNVALDQLKNGARGKLELSSDVHTTEARTNVLEAKVGGNFQFLLAANLLPKEAQGNVRLDVGRAEGSLAELAKLAAIIECDVTPTDIRNAGIRFERGGKGLGRIRLSGPMDVARKEGELKLEIASIDRQVLNLFGATRGWDFEESTFNGGGVFKVAQNAGQVSGKGNVTGSKVSIREKTERTPQMDLSFDYQFEANLQEKSANLQALNISGRQAQNEFLRAQLVLPMAVKWGGKTTTFTESTLQLAVNKLNLGDWRLFVGTNVTSGVLDLKANIVAQANALKLDSTAQVQNLNAAFGTNRLSNAQILLTANAGYSNKDDKQHITANANVQDFSGQMADYRIEKYQVRLDCEVDTSDTKLDIRQAKGALAQAGQAGGNFEVTGSFDRQKKSGDFTVKLTDINQNAIGPFVTSAFGEKKLVTIALNGNAKAKMDGDKESALKADFRISNLVVRDPKKPQADPALSAELSVDGGMRDKAVDLRELIVRLSPTDRAKNELKVTGKLDLSRTNALAGTVTVRSDSFDVTPFYELSSPAKTQAQKKGETPAPAPAPAPRKAEEPAPVHLPVEHLTAEVNIGKFFLREIAITDLRCMADVRGGHIVVNPVNLAINGAPVSANIDLDLEKKGYVYVTSFSANGIPLEPIANSFIPDKRGQYRGSILASGQIKGAGTTGTSLKQNLAGKLDFNFTNANIQIVGEKLRPFLNTIALVLNVPELVSSPLNAAAIHSQVGDGKIALNEFTMTSDAFTAGTRGEIPISDVLSNSPIPNLPMSFALRRSLAQKARMIPSGADTNAEYVMLPTFIRVAGTIGQPKAQIDKAVLAGTLLNRFGGKIPGVDDKAGNLIQGLGGLLSRQPSATNTATNAAPSTNVATNAPAPNVPVNQLLDLFRKPKK